MSDKVNLILEEIKNSSYAKDMQLGLPFDMPRIILPAGVKKDDILKVLEQDFGDIESAMISFNRNIIEPLN